MRHGDPGSGDPRTRSDPDVDAELLRLTDEQRAADAIEARRLEHSLRQQSAESGSFGGVLTDLAERGDPVLVSTTTGRQLRGTVTSLGTDHLALQSPTGERSLVATAAITAVRSTPGRPRTVGDRDVRGTRGLAAVLSDLAPERPTVVAHLAGGDAVAGTIWTAGLDLLCVRTSDGSIAYVAVDAISDVILG